MRLNASLNSCALLSNQTKAVCYLALDKAKAFRLGCGPSATSVARCMNNPLSYTRLLDLDSRRTTMNGKTLSFGWVCWLGLAFVISLQGQDTSTLQPPPAAPVRPVTDEYFGQKIVDPYRWMEGSKSEELLSWMKAQNAYTRSYLDRLPEYPALLQRCREVNTGSVKVRDIKHRGSRYIYSKLKPGDNLAKLYVREDLKSSERLLFDPARQSTDKEHFSLGDISLSDDGRYASYLVPRGGGEYGDIHFVDLNTDTAMPDSIRDTRWWAGSWAPDGRSILYLRFQKLAPNAPPIERAQRTAVYLHRLGDPAAADKPIFGYGVNAQIKIAPEMLSFVGFVKGSAYVLGRVNTGVSPESEFYVARVADLSRNPVPWRRVASREDQVSQVIVHGENLYILSFKGAPRYRVLKTSVEDLNLLHAQVVFPGSDAVVQRIETAKDGLYIETLDGGPHRVYRLDYDSDRREEAPVDRDSSGTISDVDPTREGILLAVDSWTRPPAVFSWNPGDHQLIDTHLQPPSPFDLSAIEVTTTKVRSYDGVLVPLVIVGKKGLSRDSSNPTLLSGYGAYGAPNTSPTFQTFYLPWLESGGLLAYAGVRGGGEYGEAWHLAGKMATKPNTWKDFIACAEYLIGQRYTSASHLGGLGASAGGILAGNALAERPDLFGAMVIPVGISNALRYERTANGAFNTAEFGSVKTEEGFRSLLAMDAYNNLKNGNAYPAVLLQCGLNDPRVEPFFSAKFAARLQATSSSGKPVLLDVTEDTGHGLGSSQEQWSRVQADLYAFLLAQLRSPKTSATVFQ